ncbi:MAG: AMP-binding protein [Sneathiella sp.]
MTESSGLLQEDPQETIFDLINRRAAETPSAIYLMDPETGDATTFADLKQQVSAVAVNIRAQGIRPGDSVAYALTNSPKTAILILGIVYGGYLATAINLVAGSETIAYVVEHSETSLILADEAGKSILEKALHQLDGTPPILVPDSHFFAAVEGEIPARQTDEILGLLMYTSGTTGQPKGVLLSHGNLISGGRNTAQAHRLAATDCGLCILPLYHINGLCVSVLGTLVSGGSLVIPPKFSVTTFWALIEQYRCTWFSVVPTQISYLLHDEASLPSPAVLTTLRFCRSASAPLSPEVQTAFENRFGIPIVETMGLTETAAQILSNPLPPGIRKIGSAGMGFGNEIRIGDIKQQEMARGDEGEVLVRGPNVMQRYLKNKTATSEALTADGWLRSGDLGRMDADGYVFITGRLKELIIKGGENIAPREIDEALYGHPDIVEAAAFSIKCARYGETVEAAVMRCEGSSVTEDELIEMCKSRIGAFKAPDRIHFLTELPKGPSGKIQRIKIAELVANKTPPKNSL